MVQPFYSNDEVHLLANKGVTGSSTANVTAVRNTTKELLKYSTHSVYFLVRAGKTDGTCHWERYYQAAFVFSSGSIA